MILDAAELEPGTRLQADLCIVGAGAAGIALALAFANTRHQIIVLESGGPAAEPATQALCDGELAPGTKHLPPSLYRRRQFGGATTIWGGRCAPLDPIDLETRDWIPHSGWPIDYAELRRFYPAANAICEAGDFDYQAPPNSPELLENFAGAHFSADTLERFSCPTNFATRYRARLAAAPNIRVILHANATHIATTLNGASVAALTARTLAGRRLTVDARIYVLATGGLEIPRLLLASRDQHPNGIGNAHDQLGRYYMCHIAGTLGEIRPRVPIHYGYTLCAEGIYCRRRFALRPAAQRRLRTGNLIARLHHPRIADPSHASAILSALHFAAPFITPEYAIRLRDRATPAATLHHALNILRAPAELTRFLAHWLSRRTLADRKFPSIIAPPPNGAYTLDIHAEQRPNPLSRITLATTTDALGLPRLRIDWRPLPADFDDIRRALAALAQDLAPIATLTYDPETIETLMLRDGAYGGHHIGTARMSSTPRTGVVNEDCRVHGLTNLYLAGSAVFPTSSQANPTLTVVALALRLAEHLGAPVQRQKEAVLF